MTRLHAIVFGLALGLAAMVPPGGQSWTATAEAAETELDGKQLFANSCGFCHAKGGRKAGKGPKLANSPRSDEYIVKRIKKGKTGRMPAFGGAFDDTEIQAILAYIRGLDEPGQ
jgi:mono/diheme cytochrome c family protein